MLKNERKGEKEKGRKGEREKRRKGEKEKRIELKNPKTQHNNSLSL